jgi:hypothetical protein
VDWNIFRYRALPRLTAQWERDDEIIDIGRHNDFATGTVGFASGLHWVVGNRATNRCEIVTSNPIVIGDSRFEDGSYKSLNNAKLARSTTKVCPKVDPAAGQ